MRFAGLAMFLALYGVGCFAFAQSALTLQEALRIADEHSPRLQATRARREAAEMQAKAISAMLLPQVSLTGWLARGTVENMLASAPAVMPDSMRMAGRDGFASVQAKLALPLFTGGRLQAMAGASRAQAQAMSAEEKEVRQEVRLEVTARYLQALLKRSLAGEVAQRQLQAQQEQTRVVEAMYEQGKVPLAYVLRSRAAESQARQSLLTAQAEFQKSLLDLQESMGVKPTGELSLPTTLADLTWSIPNDVGEAVERGLHQRALLQAQALRVRLMNLERRSAQGARLPQVALTVSGDWLGAQSKPTDTGYTVAVVVSVPVWTGGSLQAQVREATARVQEAEADLRTLQLQVENEVRRAWLDMQTAEKNLVAAEMGVRSAEEAYRVAIMRVNEGKAPLVEQIDALAALTEARTNLFQARTNSLLARARLLRAMGEL